MSTSSRTLATVATSFPRFLELPVEIQMTIWEHAISAIIRDHSSWNDGMHLIRNFQSRLWRGPHGLNPIHGFYVNGETAPPWIGPKSGKELQVAKNWHTTSWVGLLNTCLMSRMLVLKWMREMAEKATGRDPYPGRRKRLLLVVGEMTDDIDARLRR